MLSHDDIQVPQYHANLSTHRYMEML